jgi:hypothetical protein
MLGDGSLYKTKNGINVRLEFNFKHREFAQYVAKQYKVVRLNPTIRKQKCSDNRRIIPEYFGYTVQTECNPSLTEQWKRWYKPNPNYPHKDKKHKYKKFIPKDLILTPKSCLNWYLGDGSLRKNSSIEIATHSFTEVEIEFLINALWRDIKIKSTKNKSGKSKFGIQQWVMYISPIESKKFLDYIGPCPVKCYEKKWNWKDNGNLKQCENCGNFFNDKKGCKCIKPKHCKLCGRFLGNKRKHYCI